MKPKLNTRIIGVLGLGVFGRTVAKELSKYDVDVIAIDNRQANVQDVADYVTKAAVGDITDYDFLKNIGVKECDIVIIATGTNLESSVLAAMHCKKLGVPRIVGKARSLTFEEVLYEVGVHVVVSPERDSGVRLASKILRNKIDEVLRLDDDTPHRPSRTRGQRRTAGYGRRTEEPLGDRSGTPQIAGRAPEDGEACPFRR